MTVDDIDLWELNEAFACQVIYCRDRLGIPDEILNVNGGAIALGHPFMGCSYRPELSIVIALEIKIATPTSLHVSWFELHRAAKYFSIF